LQSEQVASQPTQPTLRETKPDRFEPLDQAEVIIDHEVYDKILYWVDKSPVEISGLGKVVMKDGVFHVVSAYLLDQKNTAASTDITPEAVAKLMYESKDDEGHLNFWWHSHVNMKCFWSSTDTETIRQLGEKGWCLATVFNKKDEYRSAYYQKGDDFMPEIFVDNMDTTSGIIDTDRENIWEKEYTTKCKSAPPKSNPLFNPHRSFDDNPYYHTGEYKHGLTIGEVALTEDDLNNMAQDDIISGVDLYTKTDIIREASQSKLSISKLNKGEITDLFDAFVDYYGDEPMSVIDLNAFFTITLQGDNYAI